MDLIVFDLDGTLLNATAEISPFTRTTLQKLTERNIAYTVATGRTIHSGRGLIDGHGFTLPHIYNNGVVMWDPSKDQLSLDNSLTTEEIHLLRNTAKEQNLTPFISVIGKNKEHSIYMPPVQSSLEQRILEHYQSWSTVDIHDIKHMPADAVITNVNVIGDISKINAMHSVIDSQAHLVGYSGPALEGNGATWMDVHHSHANKGSSVTQLKSLLGASHVICFGDNTNDLSMFEIADECYAMANATDSLKAIATSTIGHHEADGVAQYLTERFAL